MSMYFLTVPNTEEELLYVSDKRRQDTLNG